MRALRIAALASVAALALGASAQAPTPGAFKGKVKPGLYEVTTDTDMGNMPGIPKEQKQRTSKRQQCLTDAEIGKLAEESNAACKTSNFRMAADGATFRVNCAGNPEMNSEGRITFAPAGYVVESKVTLKFPDNKPPVNMSQRSTSKYLGPCPK